MRTRTEYDAMGEVEVPEDALYGAQSRRALLNFPVSGWRLPESFVRALGRIKRACARVNCELGLLDAERTAWIESAAGEVADGLHGDQFVVDVFQTGSGTSTNMNANEVIANRAIQLAGGVVGSKDPIHPNDHVNLGQSSNDVIPAALHVAAAERLKNDLLPALEMLQQGLESKAGLFDTFLKIGRTHLMDATPIRMGQVFSGYAAQAAGHRRKLAHGLELLSELPLGGTAVGTGLNTGATFGARVAAALAEDLKIDFVEAENHFEAQAVREAVVAVAGDLKALALSLDKIMNDIRFLASGPRCGLGELQLPATQPGSSIMPGKVNPVICEAVMQVGAFTVGADAAISHAAATLSNFELCAAAPLMAWHLLETMRLQANAIRVFQANALDELACHVGQCEAYIEHSLALCTALVPHIGYDRAGEIAKEACLTDRTVREIAREKSGLDEATLATVLDARRMTGPEGRA